MDHNAGEVLTLDLSVLNTSICFSPQLNSKSFRTKSTRGHAILE